MTYQAAVAAYFGVLVLAEQHAARIPGFAAASHPVSIWCETGEALDDVEVRFSDGTQMLIQAKRGVGLLRGPKSQLGKACAQLVNAAGAGDELALVADPTSPQTVTRDLAELLDTLRTQPLTEPLSTAKLSKRLAHAQTVLLEHLRRAWRAKHGTAPTGPKLREILNRTRVLVLALEDNGSEARESESLLRTSVLEHPVKASDAWAHLLATTLALTRRGSGMGRPQLQRALLDEGLALQAAPSVRRDVEQLAAVTRASLRALRRLSHIELGQGDLRIERKLAGVIRAAAEDGPLVVVGEPGVGKSGALHQVAHDAQDAGLPVVALLAEELDSPTQRGLADELRLEHDLVEVLAAWPVSSDLLLFDGLDAGGDRVRRAMTALIRRVAEEAPQWHVVASIRTFDLHHDQTLPQHFPALPHAPIDPGWTDPDFEDIRHVRVQRLTDEEIDQLAPVAPELHHLVTAATERARELARVPFNLRLLAQLAESVPAERLRQIDSPVALLDVYWRERVDKPAAGRDARERLLFAVCEHATSSRRLTVPRSLVRDGPPELFTPAETLLRDGVLIERGDTTSDRDPDRLAFAHNVLFDYAVARLLLRSPGDLVARLRDDPPLLLRIRPSVELHLRWLWSRDRSRKDFWAQTIEIAANEDLGELPKTVAPAVVADLAAAPTDFEALVTALADDVAGAENVVGHIASAINATASKRRLLDTGSPWAPLLDDLTRTIPAGQPRRLWAAQRLMLDLADQLPGDPAAAELLGQASRRLLDIALQAADAEPRFQRIAEFGIEVVRKTFTTDSAASKKLLRRLIEPARVASDGYWQLFQLADGIGELATVAPQFVADIYVAAFSHEETSDEVTPMLASQLLPLRSNRQQDYGMARHLLAEEYPKLIAAAPRLAVDVLDLAISHMARVERYQTGKPKVTRFVIAGRRPGVRADSSYAWHQHGAHNDAEKMLEVLEQHLTAVAADADQAAVDAINSAILQGTRNAALWRILLASARRYPQMFLRSAGPVLTRPRLHLLIDLEHPAGQALAALHPRLEPPMREAAEKAVMDLPGLMEPALREMAERRRDELLSTLDPAAIIDEGALTRRTEIAQAASPVGPPAPPFDFDIGWQGPVTDGHILRQDGIDPGTPANATVLAMAAPLGDFASTHNNEAPNAQQRKPILPQLRVLQHLLQNPPPDADQAVLDVAWGKLASAAEALARRPTGLRRATGDLVRDILLAAADHPEPRRLPESLDDFDKHPMWSAHTPRIEAAQGMTCLAQDPRWATADVTDAVLRLSRDLVPSVRLAVSRRAAVLLHTSPELAWQIVEERVAKDPSAAVLEFMLDGHGPFRYLANRDQDRALTALRKMVSRERRRKAPRDQLLSSAYSFLASSAVWRDAAIAHHSLEELLKDPDRHQVVLASIVGQLRDATVYGAVESEADAGADAVRQRALSLYGQIVTWAAAAMGEIHAEHRLDSSRWPDDATVRWKSAAELADAVGDQLYFASGVFQERQGRDPDDRHANPQQRLRLYVEAYDILEQLSRVGLPRLAHRLVELLAGCTDADPNGVFALIANTIRAGGQYGYQHESMAAKQTTQLVERYLAEHRELFEDDERARQLIDILDLFVAAGSPAALRLVYGLDELYR